MNWYCSICNIEVKATVLDHNICCCHFNIECLYTQYYINLLIKDLKILIPFNFKYIYFYDYNYNKDKTMSFTLKSNDKIDLQYYLNKYLKLRSL